MLYSTACTHFTFKTQTSASTQKYSLQSPASANCNQLSAASLAILVTKTLGHRLDMLIGPGLLFLVPMSLSRHGFEHAPVNSEEASVCLSLAARSAWLQRKTLEELSQLPPLWGRYLVRHLASRHLASRLACHPHLRLHLWGSQNHKTTVKALKSTTMRKQVLDT